MKVTVLCDLGYGDSGKGSVTDYLCREEDATLIVRYNGGSQAGHNVITPDGTHHTFRQFGSGMFNEEAYTYLSWYCVVDPYLLNLEAEQLMGLGVEVPFERLFIDPLAPLVTPFHIAANRLREMSRGLGRHGSCGRGIGEVMADQEKIYGVHRHHRIIRAADVAQNKGSLINDLEAIRKAKLHELTQSGVLGALKDSGAPYEPYVKDLQSSTIAEGIATVWSDIWEKVTVGKPLIARDEHIVFEGAQGVLLDENYGFHPYTTWSTTTTANANQLIKDLKLDVNGDSDEIRRWGLIRAYSTRHGNGPFVPYDKDLTFADPYNTENEWQGPLRLGSFDFVATRYALEVCGDIDGLVVTCVDQVANQPWQTCYGYHHPATQQTYARITPGNKPDLDRQARLTNLLAACAAVITEHETPLTKGNVSDRLGALGKPVVMVSEGPTAKDKVTL